MFDFKPRITFEELADKIGLSEIFSGTEVDEATQNALLEWLFDYRLCTDDETKFLRYFRRRLNMNYQRYLDLVRILSVMHNFDPYVSDYFQRVIEKNGEEQAEDSRNSEVTTDGSITATKGAGSTTTRTPNLTTENTTDNDVHSTVNSENSGTDSTVNSGTQTNAKTGSDTVANSGTQTNAKSGSDTVHHDYDIDDTVNTKGDAFAIAYPEANLNGIPVDIDAQRSINYANTESLSMGKTVEHKDDAGDQTTTYNSSDTRTDNLSSTTTYGGSDTRTDNLTSATTYGSENDTTTDSNTDIHSVTSETGTDTTVVTNTGSDTTSEDKSVTTVDGGSSSKQNSETIGEEYKGRKESVADIIPRATKAIQNSNALQWFVDSLLVCFDCID